MTNRKGTIAGPLLTLGFLLVPAAVHGGPIFDYRFEDGSDGAPVATALDSSGYGLHGTATGLKYTSSTAPTGGNLALDARGDSNFFEVSDNSLMHLQEFTLRVLVNPAEPYGVEGGSVPHAIVTKKLAENGSFPDSFSIYYHRRFHAFQAFISFGGETGVAIGAADDFVSGGQWYDVALSLDRDVDGATDTLSLFVNGVLAASQSGNFPDIAYSDGELLVGAGNFDSSSIGPVRRNFNGLIDEVNLSTLPSNAVPEPASLVLLGIGAVALAGYSCRRRSLKQGDALRFHGLAMEHQSVP